VKEPTAHVLQLAAPLALYTVSPPHGACTLEPSHEDPALHALHDVRVFAVPPAVKAPAAHVLQLPAPALLNLVSSTHAEHALLPPVANEPAVHGVWTLEPSHEEPALHALHVMRVFVVPPAVKEPAVHVLQLRAPAALYLVSLPHGVCTLEPSHEEPALHALHDVRVLAVPPAVKAPAAHVLQLPAPALLNLVSSPHAEHALLPPVANEPALHGVWTLEPSHEEPALHALHVMRVFVVPPAVKEPAVHVLQPLALEVLNFVSTPHGVKALVPSHCS
jgi:hypothetical protein